MNKAQYHREWRKKQGDKYRKHHREWMRQDRAKKKALLPRCKKCGQVIKLSTEKTCTTKKKGV